MLIATWLSNTQRMPDFDPLLQTALDLTSSLMSEDRHRRLIDAVEGYSFEWPDFAYSDMVECIAISDSHTSPKLKLISVPVRPVLALALLGLIPVLAGAQGSIQAWGNNNYFQISHGPSGTDFIQASGGQWHCMALRIDGSIESWGLDFAGLVTNTPGGTGFTEGAAGDYHSLALHSDGSIVSWGPDNIGLVTNTPTGTGFTMVAAGGYHSLALRANGSIEAWGEDNKNQVSGTPVGSGFTMVAGGTEHSLALRADASIAGWGRDDYGQVSGAPAGAEYTQVAGGLYHSLALRTDGSIVSWGNDSYSQVSGTPLGTGFTQVAAGQIHSLALRADGSIVSWGRDRYGVISNTPAETGFTYVAGGVCHSLSVRASNPGIAHCFGDGSGTACPCGASGNPGEGCANTGGAGGAILVGIGSALLSLDSFGLYAEGVPGDKPGLILRGANQLNGGLGNPVGDGLLCVGGQTARSQVQVTSAGLTTFTDFQGQPFGASSYGLGLPTNYQFWYRDPGNTCSGSGFNFSNAWTTTWLP